MVIKFRFVVFSLILALLFSNGTGFALTPGEVLQKHDPSTDVPTSQSPMPVSTVNGADGQGASSTATAPRSAPTSASIAVLSDLHVSHENLASCRKAVDAVNDLPGISFVALLGDLCEKTGTAEELDRAARLVGRLSAPIFVIPGNHDIRYKDRLGKDGKKEVGTPAEKATKLERFRKTFKQKSLRFTMKVAGQLLVFLPIDALSGKSIVTISEASLRFFREAVEANPGLPTIVFCHAPLQGSYEEEDTTLTPFHATAQPAGDIRDILRDNPQVYLWVAGHRHIKP